MKAASGNRWTPGDWRTVAGGEWPGDQDSRRRGGVRELPQPVDAPSPIVEGKPSSKAASSSKDGAPASDVKQLRERGQRWSQPWPLETFWQEQKGILQKEKEHQILSTCAAGPNSGVI